MLLPRHWWGLCARGSRQAGLREKHQRTSKYAFQLAERLVTFIQWRLLLSQGRQRLRLVRGGYSGVADC